MAVQEEEGCLSQGFALIGVITVAYLAITQGWRILCGFRAHFLSHWWKPNLSQYGTWAVVTGATDGIGKSYAEELARRGFDIVLISRNVEKLQRVAEGIEQKSGRKTKIIQADFTGDVGIYTPIEEGLKGLDIGILVNNVGMTYSDNAARFLDVPNVKKRVIEVINCNVMSVLHMTNIVLPDMLKKKKGLIINIASEAGTLPYPMIAVYSSTKVFVDYFSRCLQTEYSSQGIRVQSVLPLLVSTNMTFGIKSNIFVKSSDSFAYDALNTVGVTTRTHGCLSHDLQHFFVHLFITDFILSSSATNFFILRATKALEKMGTMKKD
ncbi:estradiol 17-beta-dehydrogenase 12-B-like L homeolog [Xenopus laevis]|uniref:3-ketoacyl-CoA reductase n=1 Tax=Xenopus laevis TaxID=8355 RepID=Q6GMA9_XENLA|nr:estradiol 17-beta-dehydrogenase 12-B-like L homeolog [Xenopus laevis]AAH74162.1 MGC81939 protein [Xenopus laevis]AIN79099.1 20beta-hydroxysteroid dehydrogenase type 2 [Xenopus laevis]